jgi:hypothetical protein
MPNLINTQQGQAPIGPCIQAQIGD